MKQKQQRKKVQNSICSSPLDYFQQECKHKIERKGEIATVMRKEKACKRFVTSENSGITGITVGRNAVSLSK